MVAVRPVRCNFGYSCPAVDRRFAPMTEPAQLLALRLSGRDFALEVGRTYRLGADAGCDFALRGAGVALVHAELAVHPDRVVLRDLGSAAGTVRNGERIQAAVLAPADRLEFGAAEALVVRDTGEAELVPLPALRLLAAARRSAAIRAAARADRRTAPTFRELVAAELRHAPWLGLSLLLHALLLLVLLWWLPEERARGIELARHRLLVEPPAPEPPPVPPVVVEPASPELPAPEVPHADAPPEPPTALPPPAPRDLPVVPPATPVVAADAPMPAQGAGLLEPLVRPGPPPRPARTPPPAPAGSPGFQRTVSELRRTGLEIVFVCDSTGSMATTLRAAKDTMALMLGVLRRLVPEARFGLVTYRDHGKAEEYVIRQLPLAGDVWRAVNFVQGLAAGGGGDRPEAVRDGLEAAFAQPWQAGTRRVVVLVGDAPPHERDQVPLLAAVRKFARDPQSRVHALVVQPELAGKDTQESFAAIAKAGRGECLPLTDHTVVLRLVLALAFGREYAGDLATVVDQVAQQQLTTATWALDLARRGGPELAAELLGTPVPDELVHALARMPRREVSLELVELLAAPSTPGASRQAIAWVLQRQLGLLEPLLGPFADGPPEPRSVVRLRAMVDRALR